MNEWMNEWSSPAVAFLESLTIADDDLRLDKSPTWSHPIEADRFRSLYQLRETQTKDPADLPAFWTGSSRSGPGLYYFINYRPGIYSDRCLSEEDTKKLGRKIVDLLQNMQFPELDGDPLIDNIIGKCWHNRLRTSCPDRRFFQ